MNNPEVEALRTVDQLDTKALKLKREIAELPEELEKHRRETKATAERLERCRNEQKRLQREVDRIELETRANGEQVRRYQIQQNTAKTNEEYAALKKQIDALKKVTGDLEDKALAHFEELDQLKVEEAAAKKALGDAERKLKEAEGALSNEIALLEQELASIMEERSRAEAKVGSTTLLLYRRILEKNGDRGLAPLHGRICQGCFIEIPPNALSVLLSGKEVVTCKQCMRILYLEKDYRALSPTSYLVGERDRGDDTSKDGNW